MLVILRGCHRSQKLPESIQREEEVLKNTPAVAMVMQPSTGFLNVHYRPDGTPTEDTEDTEDCLERITIGLTRAKSGTITLCFSLKPKPHDSNCHHVSYMMRTALFGFQTCWSSFLLAN